MGRKSIIAGIAAVGLALLLLAPTPALAIPGAPGPPPGRGADTDVTMTGTAEGQGVAGSLPTGDEISDPAAAYPSSPPAGFAPANQGFAGIITAQGAESSTQLRMFCIDIRTATYPGLGYENGSWEQAGMPNVGYVARLLTDYYPNTAEPAAAPNDNVRAAAVQAAIWYFTDYFVLAPGDPVRPYAEAIVNAVRVLPPLPSPTPPSLTITPADTTSPVGTPAGPFTIATDAPAGALVFATGGEMFGDPAGSVAIANGSTVSSGQQIYIEPDDPDPGASVSLLARGEASVPSGNVYIYDQNTPGVADAQRLILAETVTVITNVTATASFFDPPLVALVVSKAITGSAAGAQGPITIRVACDNGFQNDYVVPAGATGTQSITVENLPVGTTCTVSEPITGATDTVAVMPTGGGPVTLTVDGAATTLTNDYTPVLPQSGGSAPLPALGAGALLIGIGVALTLTGHRSRRGVTVI